jgi:hypothetical protein
MPRRNLETPAGIKIQCNTIRTPTTNQWIADVRDTKGYKESALMDADMQTIHGKLQTLLKQKEYGATFMLAKRSRDEQHLCLQRRMYQ